jgi:hypothetical protein
MMELRSMDPTQGFESTAEIVTNSRDRSWVTFSIITWNISFMSFTSFSCLIFQTYLLSIHMTHTR